MIKFTENELVINDWNPDECTIEKTTDGIFALVDHSIQQTVAWGDDINQFEKFLSQGDNGVG